MRIRGKITLVAAIMVCALAPEMFAQGRNSSKNSPSRTCPDLSGPPMSLARVVEFLLNLERRRCIVESVKKLGVGFRATQEVLQLLRDLNAPEALFPLIPPVPVAQKPKTAGPLTVTCEPNGCDVIAGERYFGVTERGKKVIAELLAGEVTIQVRSEGWESQSRKVALRDASPREEKFTLIPSLASRRQAGRDLLQRVVAALGGIDLVTRMGEQSGSGSMTPGEVNQAPEWGMTFSQQWNSVNMSFHAGKVECSVSVANGTPAAECKGKLKKFPADPQVTRAAVLFEKYRLPVGVVRLLSRSVVSGKDSSESLETDDGPDSYVLTVGAEGLPSELVYRAKADAPPTKITYSKYLQTDKRSYPGQIAIAEDGKTLATYAVRSVQDARK